MTAAANRPEPGRRTPPASGATPAEDRTDGQAQLQQMFEEGYTPSSGPTAPGGPTERRAAGRDMGAGAPLPQGDAPGEAEQILRTIEENVSRLRTLLGA